MCYWNKSDLTCFFRHEKGSSWSHKLSFRQSSDQRNVPHLPHTYWQRHRYNDADVLRILYNIWITKNMMRFPLDVPIAVSGQSQHLKIIKFCPILLAWFARPQSDPLWESILPTSIQMWLSPNHHRPMRQQRVWFRWDDNMKLARSCP